MGTGLVARMIVSVSSPDMALLLGGGFGRLVDALFGMVDEGMDVEPTALAALALISRLGLAIIVAPVALVAIGSELFRMRSGLIQSGLTGLLAALLPLALLGPDTHAQRRRDAGDRRALSRRRGERLRLLADRGRDAGARAASRNR